MWINPYPVRQPVSSRLKIPRYRLHPGMINCRIDLLPINHFMRQYPQYSRRLRWEVFEQWGVTCPTCGIVGTEVLIWYDHNDFGFPDRYHTDMVGYNLFGEMVLMTMDHIIPKSKGGPKNIDNLRTQCQPCNSFKSNREDLAVQQRTALALIVTKFCIPLVPAFSERIEYVKLA